MAAGVYVQSHASKVDKCRRVLDKAAVKSRSCWEQKRLELEEQFIAVNDALLGEVRADPPDGSACGITRASKNMFLRLCRKLTRS